MLFVGMGTEAVVFFLAAFDRPFDKTEIGKELPHDFESDEEIERAEGLTTETAPDVAAQPGIAAPGAPHNRSLLRKPQRSHPNWHPRLPAMHRKPRSLPQQQAHCPKPPRHRSPLSPTVCRHRASCK